MDRIFGLRGRRRIFFLHYGMRVQLSQVILVCEFDIIKEFIIAGHFGKLKGRTVPEHKCIQGIAIQACYLFYCDNA